MKKLIVAVSLATCSLLYVVEQILDADYFVKTGVKLLLFLVLPLLLLYLKKMPTLHIRPIRRKHLIRLVLINLLFFVAIFVGFTLFSGMIDLDSLVSQLASRKITVQNFLAIGLYITLINSFVEELFFRGFIFSNMKDNMLQAHLYSSLLFAVYHVAIFQGWFSLPILALALLGLFVAGAILNFAAEKTESVVGSWMVHMGANIAIIIIGFQLLRGKL